MEALDVIGTPTPVPHGTLRPYRAWLIAAGLLIVVASAGAFLTRRASNASPTSSVATDGEATKSLALLPFASVGDTANAYFAEGIADELTTALARLPGLRLAGRTSAARYKQRGTRVQEIGAALKVGAVCPMVCSAQLRRGADTPQPHLQSSTQLHVALQRLRWLSCDRPWCVRGQWPL